MDKLFERGTAILSILVIPLIGWGIKLEVDRAVHLEKIVQLEKAQAEKVEVDSFRTRNTTVDKALTEARRQIELAQGVKKDLNVITVAQGRTEEKIDGIKTDLEAIKRIVLTPVPRIR